ncbi:MAG TPA: potassium/proton antiporter, partial [Burkholderiales bacterium]|nr:potassium/proton antiporter [Burkholderiales bacterium]
KEVFRVALWPAVSLAILGVIITAVVVGSIATWLLKVHWMHGLLIGAIIGSTDAAAVFGLLHTSGTELKQRVAATLEIESASNDPMAIFLTLALVAVLAAGGTTLTLDIVADFFRQFGIGALTGAGGGLLLAALVNRLDLVTGLYPLLVAAGGLLIFAAAIAAGGSGFLAIYLAGIVLGNKPLRASQNILRVHDGLAWLSQITMFLMLGLLITPSELLKISFEGLVIALALMFLARPVAVFASLLPFRFPWREQLFISWIGLRGAVPMILAIFPMTAGVENSTLYFNIAFFVVLTSLLCQGWTMVPAARGLGLEIPPTRDPVERFNLNIPGHLEREILCYRVNANTALANRPLDSVPLPMDSHVTTVVREHSVLTADKDLVLMAGDLVYVFADPGSIPQLNRLFDPHLVPDRLEEHRFYGDFILNGTALLADISEVYGFALPDSYREQTLDSYLNRVFHGRPVVGDVAPLSTAELVINEIDQGRITKVGLRLRKR